MSKKENKSGSAGIFIKNSGNVRLDCNAISGFETGIKIENSTVEISNTKFQDTQVPIRATNSTVRVDKTSSQFSNDQGHPATANTFGWQPSKGPRIPCHCPACDTVFASKTITAFNSNFYIGHVTETCIFCGHLDANVARGLFEFGEDVVRLIAGSKASVEQLVNLKEMFETAFGVGEFSKDDVVAIERVVPGLTKRVMSYAAGVLILIGIINGLLDIFDRFPEIPDRFWSNARDLHELYLDEYIFQEPHNDSPVKKQIQKYVEQVSREQAKLKNGAP